MENINNFMPYMNTNMAGHSQNNPEALYPDIYRCMYPHVKSVVHEMHKSRRHLKFTEEILNSMCNEVINKCGMYVDDFEKYDSMAAAAPVQFGRNPRYDDPPAHHGDFRGGRFGHDGFFPGHDRFGHSGNFNRNNLLRDLVRILILRELF